MKNILLALPGAFAGLLIGASQHLWDKSAWLWFALLALGGVGLVLSLYFLYALERFPGRHHWLQHLVDSNRPRRDVSLRGAIDRMATGDWVRPRDLSLFKPEHDGGEAAIIIALRDIRQLARDGDLPVWGKIARYRSYEPIPTEYWGDGQIDIFSYLRGECQTEDRPMASPRRWLELMTSRSAVEALCARREKR